MLIQPLLEPGMVRKLPHLFLREPTNSVGLLHAKRQEGLINIGRHDVELPSPPQSWTSRPVIW